MNYNNKKLLGDDSFQFCLHLIESWWFQVMNMKINNHISYVQEWDWLRQQIGDYKNQFDPSGAKWQALYKQPWPTLTDGTNLFLINYSNIKNLLRIHMEKQCLQ